MENIHQIIEEINSSNPKLKKSLILNQAQVAELLGVSQSTLENWRRVGLGPRYKKVENGKRARVLYPKIEIAKFIADTVQTA